MRVWKNTWHWYLVWTFIDVIVMPHPKNGSSSEQWVQQCALRNLGQNKISVLNPPITLIFKILFLELPHLCWKSTNQFWNRNTAIFNMQLQYQNNVVCTTTLLFLGTRTQKNYNHQNWLSPYITCTAAGRHTHQICKCQRCHSNASTWPPSAGIWSTLVCMRNYCRSVFAYSNLKIEFSVCKIDIKGCKVKMKFGIRNLYISQYAHFGCRTAQFLNQYALARCSNYLSRASACEEVMHLAFTYSVR